MKFPVDLLADVSQMELERFAHNYTNNLLYSNPDFPERLTLSDSTQVTIDISSVGFVPLYGSSDKQKILALFSPTDPFTAVALYLLDQWWPVDDILKTADPARDGAVEVKTVGERIVLYILNRVIYRAKEMSSEELPFLCHGEKDHAKILWNNGQAVGFYSVKPTGSVYNSFSTRSYQLPVMDSIFVRKCQRGKGFGLQMLEDFVLSFEEDSLGFRYPLTTSMYKVCEKYLCQYPGDKDLLWEVEGIGGPKQRTNIASKIQAMEQCVSKSLTFTEESLVITEMAEKGVVIEAITRSSGSKRRKTGEKIAEDKSEKVLRIEDIEAETPGEENVSAQKETDLHRVSELVQTEGMISVAPEERGEDTVDTTTEEAARMSDQPATVLAQQDLEEIHVTSASMTEEPQVEDEVPQDLTSIYSEPLITVENVASEIEGPEEEDQKEDTTVLVVSEEVLERHKEAETLDNVGEGTQIENTDEEKVTQQEVSLSTHASSEDKEALKAIKTVKSKAPRWRSKRQPNLQEGVAEKSPANDGRIVLRGRTVTYTPKRKYTQHSQKLSKEVEKEVDEEEEENKVPTAEGVEGLALNEGEKEEMTTVKEDVVTVEELSKEKQQLEDEQLVNEEPGVEDTMVKASFIELPDKAETELTKENEDEKVTDESEREQKGRKVETSVTQDKRDASPDEIQEPPAVQKKALRGRPPKCKPTKQSKKHEKQELEPTDEADQGTGGSASEESADQQPTDTMIDDHHKEVQEESVDKTEEKISTEELTVVKEGRILKSDKTAEDVIPSTEVNVEEELEKETSPAEETGGEEEEASQKLPEEKGEEIEVEERSAEKQKNNVEEEKVESAAGGESAVGDAEQVEDASTEAAAVLEEEDNRVEAADEINADTIQISSAEEEETTVTEECATAVEVESDTAVNEEEAVIENASVAAVEETCQKDEDKEQNMSEDEEEPIVIEKRVLRGRSVPSVTITTRRRSAKVQKAEESLSDEEKTSPSAQEKENTEPEAEMEKVEAVAEESPTEPEKVEEEQSAVSKTCADGKGVASVEESADETPNADKGSVTDEEETPTVETGVLTSGEKTVRATGSKTTKRKNDEQEEVTSEKSAEKDDEKGRRSAAVTDRRKSKRARTQCQTKEEGAKETSPAEETEAVAEAVAEESPTEPEIVEEEQSAVSKSCADGKEVAPVEESAEETPNADKGLVTDEEETPTVETGVLTSGEKTVTTKRRNCEQEEVTGEKSAEKDELVVETRVLRKGRKSAAATDRRKSKRSRTQCQTKEEGAKETSPAEETGGEEEKETQESPEVIGEETEAEERIVDTQRDNVEEEKVESAAGGESAVGDAEQVEDASTEVAAVLEEEDNRVEAADEINADTVQISSAEEEETTVTEECVTAAEVQSDTADVTGVADDATQEPDTVAAALETIVTDPVPDETVVPAAEEPQKKNINSEIPKLQKATIILVDIKKTCCHLRVKQAEEAPADGECAAPEKQQEEENEGEQVTIKQKSSNATVEAGTVEKEVLEEDNSEKEKKESAIVNEEKSEAGEALVIETSVLQSGKETVKSNRGNRQKEEDDTGEGITEKEVTEVIRKGGTDEVEGEMESVANYAVIATVPLENKQSEICADREADIPAGGDAEDSLPPAQVDKAMSFEQEVSVVETRALKCETKSSTATPRHRRTRGGKQGDVQEAENSEEPPVTTRTLRSGRRSASNAQKGKSRRSCKKIQEDEPKVEEELKSFDETEVEQEKAAKETAVEKTDKEREGKNGEIIETVSEEAASEREKSLQPEIDMEEGEAVVAQKQDVVEEQSETIPKTFAEREPEALGEECDESWKAGQAAAADELVQGETGTPLPIPANDSATLPLSEEEATPSAEEQQLEENAPQLSDLRTMTVVLVDTKTKEEQREETIAQKNVCGSPELEKVTMEEQGYKDQVEIVTEQDTGEGRAEETAKEEEAKSANDDQEPSVTETRTQRNKKQEVKATPRSKVPRRRKKKTELEKEEALEIQKEEPAVQGWALRRGRMSILVAQRCSTKTTCKQLKEGEEAEDGEKSTEVQEREKEEKQQQFTHREKGEGAKEGDAAEQIENIDADIDKEETVTEEAVIQEDAPEEEQVNSTETVGNDNTEASVGQLAEGKTSDDAEEAVTTQDIDEREQPTSASKRVKSAAGEIAQETPLTAKDDKAKCVPQKEEASIIEKAQRSGEKTVRATGSKTTKRRNCQQEEVTGEKSTEEDELAVETRVLRKGRRSAAATDRRKSKRARTQCQTDEEGAKETSPAEETGVEEESPEEKEEEIEAEERNVETQKDDVKEEKVESAAGGESAVGDAEQVEDALTEAAAVLEKDNRVEAADEINADTVQISSAEEEETTVTEECVTAVEVESDTVVNEEEAEDASVAAVEETHQKDEDKEQNMSEDKEEPIVIGKRVLRGRSVPSVTITPRRRSAKVRKAEESLSDEEKNSSSARKRKTTKVTPTRTSKRLSRF